MERKCEFWFDYHSPWSYLAATKIEAIAAYHDVRFRWRPLHLPRLIEMINGRRPLEGPAAFVRWYQQDLQDWAALYGIQIWYHPAFPLRPARALRATLFAETQNLVAPFALAVFRAYWTDSQDISDLGVLGSLGAAVGLDAGEITAAAEDPTWKQMLAANTDEAANKGIFGVPTVDACGKLFFGNDRLKMLERYLR
jgi:2-hydroxychromene-2-carboxylate isomerase